jgi:hypothetical protein
MQAALVSPDRLPDAWPTVGPLIALACARSSGKFLPQDVARAVAEGRFQLWVGIEGPKSGHAIHVMLLTRIATYPRLTVCELLACVGDDRVGWEHLLDAIEHWAKARGCALVQPIARPGWERVLKERGYRKTHVMLEKDLTR